MHIIVYMQQKKAKDEKFMANNEIKTNAEIYREQRKERLAKAAKKKKSSKADKVIRILVKAICIILVVGIVLFGAGKMLTDVFCVPQKLLSAAKYGDKKLTVAEYNYYYLSLYNQAASVSSQYDSQYGTGTGSSYFDTTVSPAEQEYPGDDAPEGVETWAQYFEAMAPTRGFFLKELYNEATSDEAKKAGFKITDEQQKEMDDSITEAINTLTENAKTADYALDNYIAKVCGEGLTEETYKELLERDTIAQLYLSWFQENAAETTSDKDVDSYYKKNRADIDIATFRFFTVSYAEPTEGSDDPSYTEKQAKARAEKFADGITSEESFIEAAKKYAPPSYQENYLEDTATLAKNLTKSSLSSISEKMGDWTYDTSRTAGDIKIFNAEANEAFYIVYIVEPAHRDTTTAGADVRHLLVQAQTTTQDAEGQTIDLSDEQIEKNFANAKKEAEKLLAKWEKGKATEKTFIKLVEENTDDTASAETGGLYEDVNSASSYVPEFLDWALAPHKKGDTDIVKTDYGYHIMYYVGADEEQKWQSDIRATISNEKYDEHINGIFEEIEEKIETSDGIISFFAKRTEKVIDRNVANAASNALSSSTTY